MPIAPRILLCLGLVSVSCLVACDSGSDDGAAAKQPAEDQEQQPEAEEEPPPDAPALGDLAAPDPGRATVAWPDWDDAKSRFRYRERMMAAVFGTLDNVSLIRLGEDHGSVMITFYGADLEPGDYEVRPSTDDTRAEHAGEDSNVFTVTVAKSESRLVSERGTVTITASSDDAVEATLDVTMRRDSRLDPAETPFRAKLYATRSDWLDSTLEHQASIREHLESR